MTEINYINIDYVQNPFKPEGAPLCAIHYNTGYSNTRWLFGANKAIKFIQAVDDLYDDYVKNDGKHKNWWTTIDMGKKPDGTPNRFKLSWVRLEVLKHYYEEIKDYISTYREPKEAISEPKITTKMDKHGDFVDYLALPCYPKKLNDIGEGLIPKLMTQRECIYMFDPASKGVTIRGLKEHFDTMGRVPLTITINTRDGRQFPLTYSVEEIECLLKYRRVIQNFASDPTCICEE